MPEAKHAQLEQFNRGIEGLSVIFSFTTGKDEKRGWGAGIQLCYVEAQQGESIDAGAIKARFADFDPQGPIELSTDDLTMRAIALQATIAEETRRKTDEFDALLGVSIPAGR